MRNEPKPLGPDDFARQTRNLNRLRAETGTVTVKYVKRDGKTSSSTGKVGFFNGKPGYDTGSVTIETEDKGPRTINLHSIHTIE